MMKYCSKCKKLDFSKNEKCDCGKKLIVNPEFDLPVKLIEFDEVNKGIIEQALIEADIPYSEQALSKVTPVMGVSDGRYVCFVPIGFMKKAIDALCGVSAMESPEYYDKLLLPENPEWKEMSPLKRKVVKFLSVIGFALLVYLCVAGVDIIVALFTSKF
ncbi:MAG: hypothetical protein IIT42_02700 [Clostridia bacterium]|nr:hypothetical protein [Clostridia bacterium]